MRAVGWARSLPINGDVKSARDWARERLRLLGWTADAPDTVDAVLLAISELVTNAHLHAHSDAQLVMTWDNHCLHVAVHDASPALPVRRPPSGERLGGRGILLVDALADDWQACPCPDGKCVIACFRPHIVNGKSSDAEELLPICRR